MARYEHLPIFKKMLDVTVYLEKNIMNFSKYHKYSIGIEIRKMCHEALALIAEANSERDKRATLLKLRNILEKIKIHLIIANELKAFNKKKSFYYIVEKLVEVSKQNEGWIRSMK